LAVKHEFKYTVPAGQTFLNLHEWVATLSVREQEEFRLAQQRQYDIRQEFVDAGALTVDPTKQKNTPYIWKDSESANKNKPKDPVWAVYWDRYLTETNTTFEIIETEI
jgi:hypothetical protein